MNTNTNTMNKNEVKVSREMIKDISENLKRLLETYNKGFSEHPYDNHGEAELAGLVEVAWKFGYDDAYKLIGIKWMGDVEIIVARSMRLAEFEFVDRGLHLKDGLTRDEYSKFIENRVIYTTQNA